MNLLKFSDKLKIHDTKEIILSNGKRLCYLIECDYCHQLHYKAQCEIIKGLKRNKKFFCNQTCHGAYHRTNQIVSCVNCTKQFSKVLSQIAKTKNNFCSKSCAATFNNKNKTYGTRRSKLEQAIETMLRLKYINLIFECNGKKAIGSELDFYFPTLSLAIQINGPLHYLPIYGQNKLDNIQKLDNEKRIICKSKNIKLIEIDCSGDKYLNKILIEQRLSQIRNILEEEGGLDPNAL